MSKPIKGVMLTHEWGESMMYRIACDCTDPDHDHNIEIEADDLSITLSIYTKQTNPWYRVNRFKQIWKLLTKNYVEYESTIILDETAAKNYAETILAAVEDVKKFKKENNVR